MSAKRKFDSWTADLSAAEHESDTSPKRKTPGRAAKALLTAALILALVPAEGGTGLPLWRREYQVTESSTKESEIDEAVIRDVVRVFDEGAEEMFVDGYSSNFSRKLLALINHYGRDAVRGIIDYIFSGVAKADAVSEALRWLADFNDSSTLALRWHLLERTLRDPSPRVRNGAILGFANLDDSRAVPHLTAARQRETTEELTRLIDKVIAQLTR